MKALISPNEIIEFHDGTSGVRVCETAAVTFEVAEPLFWVDCADDLNPDMVYWTGSAFMDIPEAPEPDDDAFPEMEVTEL